MTSDFDEILFSERQNYAQTSFKAERLKVSFTFIIIVQFFLKIAGNFTDGEEVMNNWKKKRRYKSAARY